MLCGLILNDSQNETTYILWASFQILLLVWEWVYTSTSTINFIHLSTDRLLLGTGYFALAGLNTIYGKVVCYTHQWMTDEVSIRFVIEIASQLSLAVSFWNFASRRVSLSLWLAGIWCVPTVQLFSFLLSFQPQWPYPPLLLNKLSGSWKTSSPVVSVSTPTLNQNCCSVSMCFANSVWSDL